MKIPFQPSYYYPYGWHLQRSPFIVIIAAPVYSTRAGAVAAVDCNCKTLFSVSPWKLFYSLPLLLLLWRSIYNGCRPLSFRRAPSSYYTYFNTLMFFKEHPCECLYHLRSVCAQHVSGGAQGGWGACCRTCSCMVITAALGSGLLRESEWRLWDEEFIYSWNILPRGAYTTKNQFNTLGPGLMQVLMGHAQEKGGG